ncbi:hypothetical protein MicroSTF_14420 [Microbacterium sp. STF-2]|uniref:hypothetical protein n=1 Tax=Microbacterium sp. STF-2 TaxID=3031132 RepID=UPI002AFE47C9|nr:hypothetical protein [Microbacterium sp. STF-2]MEA1264235.1 hypothetical protein [Microbacterium sp. STF-2]
MYEGPWYTTFYRDGELPWQDEHFEMPLSIGDGILIPQFDYGRFRIVDIWWSSDRHGAFDTGRHVFLEDVSRTEDDRLYQREPQYFRG